MLQRRIATRSFGADFRRTVSALGARDVLTAPASPWQNACCERVIGSLRRECFDHVVVLGERHVDRLLRDYVRCYNNDRTHRGLDADSPLGRAVERSRLQRAGTSWWPSPSWVAFITGIVGARAPEGA